MIVALVALFVSLAGNAGAVTYLAVTSKQIKDGTIQLRDIAPAARTSLRGSPGPQGSRGSRGSRGCRATEVQAGPAGKSFDPYQLERDLGELCPGIPHNTERLAVGDLPVPELQVPLLHLLLLLTPGRQA